MTIGTASEAMGLQANADESRHIAALERLCSPAIFLPVMPLGLVLLCAGLSWAQPPCTPTSFVQLVTPCVGGMFNVSYYKNANWCGR